MQEARQLFLALLGGGKALRRQRGQALEQIAGHGQDVRQGFRALLDQRHDRKPLVAVQAPGFQPVQEGGVAELLAYPAAIQPLELFQVKDGGAQGNPRNVKLVKHLLQGKFLLPVRQAPAHERQVVHQRLRQKAHLPVEGDAGGVPALGELALVRIAQERQVDEPGHWPAKGLVEQQVLGDGAEPFLAANDVGDAHQVVVHHHRQMIGGHGVRLQQHLHVHLRPVYLDGAAQGVLHLTGAAFRHLQAQHRRLACRQALRDLLGGQMQALAVIAHGFACCALAGAHLLQPLRGAEAAKGMAALQEPLGMLPVDVLALALAVGGMGAALVRALVPVQAQPLEGVDDGGFGLLAAARLIRVLNAQQELAASLACMAEAEKRHIGGAQMRVASGRWGDSGPDGHGGNATLGHWTLQRQGAPCWTDDSALRP